MKGGWYHTGDLMQRGAGDELHCSSALTTSSDLVTNAVRDISGALTTLLADVFALYMKTKNFHWYMSGKHFRDYHFMLDEQADRNS